MRLRVTTSLWLLSITRLKRDAGWCALCADRRQGGRPGGGGGPLIARAAIDRYRPRAGEDGPVIVVAHLYRDPAADLTMSRKTSAGGRPLCEEEERGEAAVRWRPVAEEMEQRWSSKELDAVEEELKGPLQVRTDMHRSSTRSSTPSEPTCATCRSCWPSSCTFSPLSVLQERGEGGLHLLLCPLLSFTRATTCRIFSCAPSSR
jgi:hypothetical protein